MNAVVKGFLNRDTFFDLFMIFVGSILWVVALICLIVPSGLLSVGFSGISILITNFVPIPLSVVVYALNVPFMLWAWKELRKRFLFYTIFTLTLQSILMEIVEFLPVYNGDIMLSAIFAGVIGGFGSGIVIRYGGSGGGVEVIGIIVKKRLGFSVGTVGMVFNVVVVSLCAFLYGLELAMYTIIFIAVFSVATDKAIAGMGKNYTAMIITSKPDELKEAIFDQVHRGVTILKGKSALSGDHRDILYTAVNQYELVQLKDIVYDIDPKVFITIHETSEIFGHFRKKNKVSLTVAQVDNFRVEDVQRPVAAQVDYYEPKVKVINRHGAVVDEMILPGENEDGDFR